MKDFPFETERNIYWTSNDDGRNRIAAVSGPFGQTDYGRYFRFKAGLRLVRGPVLLEMDDKDAQWLRRVELEKQLIAEMREKLPKNIGHEFAGLDGAPMLLVPKGEFLYGKYDTGFGDIPRQRLSLPSFYMDKYKVTTRLYDSFLRATRRIPPQDWEQQAALIGSGERPAVQITWEDANAYCHHYGKRIPTSQEWEKAARGTDGRKYPWGEEEPTRESQHMFFHKAKTGKQFGYADIGVVGAFPKGISPYGIHDLTSFIWEWTNDGGRPLRRGASSGIGYSVTEGAWRMNDGFRCVQDNP
jgi:formylglycine-generating enzyme required for sulfatase activity